MGTRDQERQQETSLLLLHKSSRELQFLYFHADLILVFTAEGQGENNRKENRERIKQRTSERNTRLV